MGPKNEKVTEDRGILNNELKKVHYSPEKGKAAPLQVWSDPDGSRTLRFPDFMTIAKDGGKVVSRLYSHEIHLVLISIRG